MSRKVNETKYCVATKDDYMMFDKRIRKPITGKCGYMGVMVRCNGDCEHCIIFNDPMSGQGAVYGKKD